MFWGNIKAIVVGDMTTLPAAVQPLVDVDEVLQSRSQEGVARLYNALGGPQ